VTVVMNGELLWHNTLWYGAREDARRRGHGGYDFAPLLAGMKPVIASADMAICHEEVPLARPGGPYRNFPLFAAPPQVVKAISATGYDVCTTASNHSVDQGFAGLKRTLDDLDRSKIAHVGTARTKAEFQRPTIFTTKQGVKIAIVAATFSLNGPRHAEGQAVGRPADECQGLAGSGASRPRGWSGHSARGGTRRNRILHERERPADQARPHTHGLTRC
jgi:poly-gamma-glutamate capsule biosynthesis protein CapA/YwtB (metallophosphatase superfamily)